MDSREERKSPDIEKLLEDFRRWEEEKLEEKLEGLKKKMRSSDREAKRRALARWQNVAKPLGSLGVLEEDIVRIAGMQGTEKIDINKRALLVFCADNGVVEEGVTQAGQEVTAAVASCITRGMSCSCLMAEKAGADVFPVDVGIAGDLGESGMFHPLTDRKIRKGTANFTKEPAMTRREALAAVLTGMDLVRVLSGLGYRILAVGEMGIGNTTTSSALASVLLGKDPLTVTGRGAGLGADGLSRKVDAIRRGLKLHHPSCDDGVGLLASVGGLDLAAMAGVFLGGAVYGIPVVIDGVICAAAAAAACAIDKRAGDFMLASHVSKEPAAVLLLEHLKLHPAVSAGLCLGEGTGALTIFPLLDMAAAVYGQMCTFTEMEIGAYHPFDDGGKEKMQ